ncbi:MAG: alpha/beta hydrolase [Oscillospiraceae bacterium]|nr:alpha/beta hydrolase [Oscillospiraceae bacterium]
MFENFKANMARKSIAKVDAKRNAGLKIPKDVDLREAIAYGSHGMNTLDVNLPKGVENPPLIVNVHGGGYFYGGTEPYRYYCASLAQMGFAVVSFNYRLAPEFKFPTPLYDLNDVMAWCLAHADEYGFDTDNIFMVGDSAGAQIASQYAVICTNPNTPVSWASRPRRDFASAPSASTAACMTCPPFSRTWAPRWVMCCPGTSARTAASWAKRPTCSIMSPPTSRPPTSSLPRAIFSANAASLWPIC